MFYSVRQINLITGKSAYLFIGPKRYLQAARCKKVFKDVAVWLTSYNNQPAIKIELL